MISGTESHFRRNHDQLALAVFFPQRRQLLRIGLGRNKKRIPHFERLRRLWSFFPIRILDLPH